MQEPADSTFVKLRKGAKDLRYPGLLDGIVDILATPLRLYDARLSKDSQMLGGSGLFQAKGDEDLRDRCLTFANDIFDHALAKAMFDGPGDGVGLVDDTGIVPDQFESIH